MLECPLSLFPVVKVDLSFLPVPRILNIQYMPQTNNSFERISLLHNRAGLTKALRGIVSLRPNSLLCHRADLTEAFGARTSLRPRSTSGLEVSVVVEELSSLSIRASLGCSPCSFPFALLFFSSRFLRALDFLCTFPFAAAASEKSRAQFSTCFNWITLVAISKILTHKGALYIQSGFHQSLFLHLCCVWNGTPQAPGTPPWGAIPTSPDPCPSPL